MLLIVVNENVNLLPAPLLRMFGGPRAAINLCLHRMKMSGLPFGWLTTVEITMLSANIVECNTPLPLLADTDFLQQPVTKTYPH